jgi:hypothetical protein
MTFWWMPLYEAYQDAGIDPKDIQAAWFGTTVWELRNLGHGWKFDYIPITRWRKPLCYCHRSSQKRLFRDCFLGL